MATSHTLATLSKTSFVGSSISNLAGALRSGLSQTNHRNVCVSSRQRITNNL